MLVQTLRLDSGQAESLTARVLPVPYFIFKGSLIAPRLRASNERPLSVRVPRAGGRSGYPSHPSEAARCASTGNSPGQFISTGEVSCYARPMTAMTSSTILRAGEARVGPDISTFMIDLHRIWKPCGT